MHKNRKAWGCCGPTQPGCQTGAPKAQVFAPSRGASSSQ